MIRRSALAALATLQFFAAHAQESEGGLPWSVRLHLDPHDVPVINTGGIDRAAVDAQDAARAAQGRIPADARRLPVNADPATSGSWYTLPNGDGVWRLRLESPGALSTELFFHGLHLPPGVTLHVYEPMGTVILGAYTGYHNKEQGVFATDAIAGEACVVEYFEPAAQRGQGSFTIAALGHRYRDLRGDERAGDCQVDVNCAEGANWTEQRDAVVRLRVVEGGVLGFCSGSLVNNVAQDCRRFLLTALHCAVGATTADFAEWKFYFGYQRTGCETGSASLSRVRTGCVKRASSNDGGGNNGSDFLLVEIDDEITPSWNPYWAGWDATTTTHTGGVCIHHPAGDEKKISTFTGNAANSTAWNGMSTHYRVTWVGTTNGWGVTEGGSSGSPLINSSGRVIGTLTGGASFCNSQQPGGQTQPDYYGRVNYHWIANGTPSNERLKTFLDPNNTGTLTMDGRYGPCSATAVVEYRTLERPLVVPNPSADVVRITFPTDVPAVDLIEVVDLAGQVVLRARVAPGATSAAMAVDGLATGTYIVRVSTNGEPLPASLFQVMR